MIIKISSGSPEKARLLARQLPGSLPSWNGIQFAINQPVDRCDWWVVCHGGGLLEEELANCDPDHIVFISMEPPDWGCPRDFYNQFSHLVTCDRNTGHRNVIFKNGLTWWVGLKIKFDSGHRISPIYSYNYDSLASLRPTMKKNKISVITSGSKHFPGHKKRLRFLDKLSSGEISNHIDVFGGHHNPVEDKMDALMPYRYHLALENSFVTDYWTEKLADPLLAWCMPIYYGCPNIREYFPRESCEIINIDDFDLTLRTLWRALESNYHEKSIGSIEAARTMILNDYNIFQLIAEICQGPGNWFEPCQLKPLSFFAERDRRLDRRVMRKVRSLANRLAK